MRPAEFYEHIIAAGLKGGCQVVAVDMNRDGKPDLVVLASGMSELLWFENPSWRRHVVADGFSGMINLAAGDMDGDGIPEIVVAHQFHRETAHSLGIVSVLKHQGDVFDQWKVTEIDRIPTSHRLRLVSLRGNGGKVVVNAALTGPSIAGHTPLVFYTPDNWMRNPIPEENEGPVYGLHVVDWDGDGRDDILTAGAGGIHLFQLGRDGVWRRTALAGGSLTPWPAGGSGDIAVGRAYNTRYLAAIEPWHGNLVVAYREEKGRWLRQVIDGTQAEGHTILAADFNGDGADEVLAGFREGRSVHLYYAADSKLGKWTRHTLDNGGMAAASCVAVDLNGDGRADIACIGSATANLKWYENRR